MHIIEAIVKIKWYRPSEGQLPASQGRYYVIDERGNHKFMTYRTGGYGDKHWESPEGEWDNKSNDQIEVWTHLLPYSY